MISRDKAKGLGLLGPAVIGSAGAVHAPQLAKEMLGSFKRGGKVKKTGLYKLHAGETVIPHGRNGNKVRKGCAAMGKHDKD